MVNKGREIEAVIFNVRGSSDVQMEQSSGEAVTEVIEGRKRFDVYLRMAEAYRNDAKAIGNLWISDGNGIRVPVSQVADTRLVDGAR